MLDSGAKGDGIANNYSIDSICLEEVDALCFSSEIGKGVALGLKLTLNLIYIGLK